MGLCYMPVCLFLPSNFEFCDFGMFEYWCHAVFKKICVCESRALWRTLFLFCINGTFCVEKGKCVYPSRCYEIKL